MTNTIEVPEFTDVDKAVLRGLRHAVATRGEDWRYPNGMKDGDPLVQRDEFQSTEWALNRGECHNLLADGSAACIIGFIAVDQNLPTSRSSNASVDANNWGVSRPVRQAMQQAQSKQDTGFTWGVAYQAAVDILVQNGYTLSEIAEASAD